MIRWSYGGRETSPLPSWSSAGDLQIKLTKDRLVGEETRLNDTCAQEFVKIVSQEVVRIQGFCPI